MKKILLLLIAAFPQAYAQCTEPVTVPYFVDSEAAIGTQLPACWNSFYNSFASTTVFETIPGPISGFDGGVMAYDTAVDNEVMPPDVPVNVYLYSAEIDFTQGVEYTLSYRFGNSDSNLIIENLKVSLQATNSFNHIDLSNHDNITGAEATSFTTTAFTVPVTDSYKLFFEVYSTSNRGLIYIDDINIQQASTMGVAQPIANSVNVYPNPVTDILYIPDVSGMESIKIYNATGQLVYQEKHLTNLKSISLKHLPSGMYILNIEGGTDMSIKIIKE